MKAGYDKPLYVLPFDHRHSYGSEVFGFKPPMTREQVAIVARSKMVIYRGFKKAVADGVPKDRAGILVDEEFGADILHDSVQHGFITCMPTEKSGQKEFDFEFGDDFAKHIEEFRPTFVKVLVRYNPEGDAATNQRQNERLKRLCDYCHANGRYYMFELLVPPEEAQLKRLGGDKKKYDLEVRPQLMAQALREIQDAGVEPDVWKIEGLDEKKDCVMIAEVARRAGRDRVGCIVLGRGEDEQKVLHWLRTAAAVPGFTGFAVGRSSFLEPILALRNGTMSEDTAATEIARRFQLWTDTFEQARHA